jgi:hypothetical protein
MPENVKDALHTVQDQIEWWKTYDQRQKLAAEIQREPEA